MDKKISDAMDLLGGLLSEVRMEDRNGGWRQPFSCEFRYVSDDGNRITFRNRETGSEVWIEKDSDGIQRLVVPYNALL